jgi:hypothetical protein
VYPPQSFGGDPGAGADTAFPAKGHGSRPGTYASLHDRTRVGYFDRPADHPGRQRAAPDVVQPAVIGFTHHRIDRCHGFISRNRQYPVDDGVGRPGYAQGIGQDDGRFNLAQFPDLGAAHQFAIPVSNGDAGGHFVLVDVVRMRHNGRGSGADVFVFDHGHMPHPDGVNIGDGVERSRRQNAGGNPQFPGSLSDRFHMHPFQAGRLSAIPERSA